MRFIDCFKIDLNAEQDMQFYFSFFPISFVIPSIE